MKISSGTSSADSVLIAADSSVFGVFVLLWDIVSGSIGFDWREIHRQMTMFVCGVLELELASKIESARTAGLMSASASSSA